VNQASTLTGIAVEYMSCNAEAFEVGDRVVVQFSGQNWASQKVIGFVDNPRPCVIFPPVYIDVTLATTITANSGTRDFMRVYTDPTCSLPEATNAVARTLASKIEYDLTIGSPFIANPEDYDTVELAASVSGVVWSAVSHVQTETPNWTLGANTFPAIDAAFSTLATRPVSTTSIRVWTIDGTNTFDTIPSDYGPTCLPLTYSSGNYFVNNPFGNLLPMVTTFEDSIEVYLASLSSMPTITVELNGVSRAYAFTGPIYSPYSSTSWRLQYDPIPL
jgi:hypothetical protein